jgi:transposase
VLDRGGMRCTWLQGRENIAKRNLIQVAGFNLGVLMRALTGCGSSKELIDLAKKAKLFVFKRTS